METSSIGVKSLNRFRYSREPSVQRHAAPLAMVLGAYAMLSVAGLAADLPDPASVKPQKLLETSFYCEGVVFDHDGNGYASVTAGKNIVKFTLDGKSQMWAETGAPNGHKILADGTHLVCDASHHAVLHLAADGKLLPNAADSCHGKPLRGPNDLSLDIDHGGFYFTDPFGSSDTNLIGTLHYVNAQGVTSELDNKLAFPNGVVLRPSGRELLMAESKRNRILAYDVLSPGKLGRRRVFAELPAKDPTGVQVDNQPDGMCLDAVGNLYVAHYGMHQVQVVSPRGKIIARYDGGNLTTSNVAFGGPKMDQLFVTGGLGVENGPGAVFRLDLGVQGFTILPPKK